MLDQTTRSAILRLRETGHGTRTIARAVGISRGAVKHVLRDGSAAVLPAARPEKGTPHRDRILELYAGCEGDFVRVHEELHRGRTLSYPALTAFCRRHRIGQAPRCPPASTTSPPARRCSMTPRPTTSPRRYPAPGADREPGLVLLPDPLLPGLPALHSVRVQGLLHPGAAVRPRRLRAAIDNTHVVGRGHRRPHGARAGDGRVRRTLRLRVPRPREVTPTARLGSSALRPRGKLPPGRTFAHSPAQWRRVNGATR